MSRYNYLLYTLYKLSCCFLSWGYLMTFLERAWTCIQADKGEYVKWTVLWMPHNTVLLQLFNEAKTFEHSWTGSGFLDLTQPDPLCKWWLKPTPLKVCRKRAKSLAYKLMWQTSEYFAHKSLLIIHLSSHCVIHIRYRTKNIKRKRNVNKSVALS